MNSYHPKNSLTQTQLTDYEVAARRQEAAILQILRRKPGFVFTCETLEDMRILRAGTPHSSYIRAIANLRKEEKIEKIGQVLGQYNRPINQYRLVMEGV